MKKYIKSAITPNAKLAEISKDPKELAQLANDGYKWVRFRVARNRSTPAEALAQLANDEDNDVRMAVAENQNTSADVLAKLANDESSGVRACVAENRNTPADVLEQFADDANWSVRIGVAENPNTSVDVLAQLANYIDETVRVGVAENPSTSIDVLVQLANDEDTSVRRAVAENPSTPLDVLMQLFKDESVWVSQAALYNPNWPKKSQKSNKSNGWPSSDKWYSIESDDEFEDMWSRYLAGPEDEVNKELQIFPEPSTQGGSGGMFIFDESEEDNEPFSIDFQDWCDSERDMAADSKNANEYKQQYRGFIESLISENWR